jgi:hypothetical protein
MRKPRAKSAKKRGGQSGNKNRLRHGFYSKSFTADENKRIDSAELDVLAEINLIRVMLSRLENQISFKETTRTDNNGAEYRDAHYLAQLHTLSAMTTNIATLIRTHHLMNDKTGDVTISIMAALEELRIEMGI